MASSLCNLQAAAARCARRCMKPVIVYQPHLGHCDSCAPDVFLVRGTSRPYFKDCSAAVSLGFQRVTLASFGRNPSTTKVCYRRFIQSPLAVSASLAVRAAVGESAGLAETYRKIGDFCDSRDLYLNPTGSYSFGTSLITKPRGLTLKYTKVYCSVTAVAKVV